MAIQYKEWKKRTSSDIIHDSSLKVSENQSDIDLSIKSLDIVAWLLKTNITILASGCSNKLLYKQFMALFLWNTHSSV